MKKLALIIGCIALATLAGCGVSKPVITTSVSSAQTTSLIPTASIDALTSKGYSIQNTYKGDIKSTSGVEMITNLALLSLTGSDNQYILTQYASGTSDAKTTSGKWTLVTPVTSDGKTQMPILTLYQDSNEIMWFKKGPMFLIPLDQNKNQLTGGNLTLLK